MNKLLSTSLSIIMLSLIILFAYCLFLLVASGSGCRTRISNEQYVSTKSKAQEAVESQGFTDVKMGAGSKTVMFSCSDSDSLLNSETFKAKNINGVEVDGVACCGWFKGCTVRF